MAGKEAIASAWAAAFTTNFNTRRQLWGAWLFSPCYCHAKKMRTRFSRHATPPRQCTILPSCRPNCLRTGDGALGVDNLRMVAIARETGAAGKFPGSGGAILGVIDVAGVQAAGKLAADAPAAADAPPEAVEAVARARVEAAALALEEAYHAEGFVFVRLTLHERRTPA